MTSPITARGLRALRELVEAGVNATEWASGYQHAKPPAALRRTVRDAYEALAQLDRAVQFDKQRERSEKLPAVQHNEPQLRLIHEAQDHLARET